MKKACFGVFLRTLLRDFKNRATSEQITKFKKKYSGMRCQETLEKICYHCRSSGMMD